MAQHLKVERDARVADATAHGAPRFVTNGVDYNDFQRVTSSVTAWEDWLPAWVENGHRHAGLAREAEVQGRTVTAGEAWNQAALSDRKSTRLNSSHLVISYAVFCLKKKRSAQAFASPCMSSRRRCANSLSTHSPPSISNTRTMCLYI